MQFSKLSTLPSVLSGLIFLNYFLVWGAKPDHTPGSVLKCHAVLKVPYGIPRIQPMLDISKQVP